MKLTDDQEYLLLEYREAKTVREKVAFENKFWDTTTAADRREFKARRQIMFLELMGRTESLYTYFCRANLHDAPDLLWSKGEEKRLAIGTLSKLNSGIRKFAKEKGVSMDTAAAQYLDEELVGGTVGRAATYLLNPRKVKAKSGGGAKLGEGESTRAQWLALRSMLGRIVATQAKGLPEISRRELLAVLECDIQQVIAAFSNRLLAARRRVHGDLPVVTRRQVEDACEYLHVNAPEIGSMADLKVAKTRMRCLVRSEHPDTGTGDTGSYNAILAAYTTLEQYNEQLGGRR